MATFEEILKTQSIERIELTTWIEQRWVRPQETPQGLLFDEVDEARIALIRELRGAFMVDDDALAIVLSLLDQLYAARRVLKSVEDAVAELPEPVRADLLRRLQPGKE